MLQDSQNPSSLLWKQSNGWGRDSSERAVCRLCESSGMHLPWGLPESDATAGPWAMGLPRAPMLLSITSVNSWTHWFTPLDLWELCLWFVIGTISEVNTYLFIPPRKNPARPHMWPHKATYYVTCSIYIAFMLYTYKHMNITGTTTHFQHCSTCDINILFMNKTFKPLYISVFQPVGSNDSFTGSPKIIGKHRYLHYDS